MASRRRARRTSPVPPSSVPSSLRSTPVRRTDGELRREGLKGTVVEPEEAAVDFASVASTAMFASLGRFRALREEELAAAVTPSDIAYVRGYERRMLEGIAVVAYEYLQAGGARVAQVLFEGLCAVRPHWSYVHLALGVCHERQGQKDEAWRAYEQAARLDPDEPQAPLNLADLAVRQGKPKIAVRLVRQILALPSTRADQRQRAKAILCFAQKKVETP